MHATTPTAPLRSEPPSSLQQLPHSQIPEHVKVPRVHWREEVCAAEAQFELELPGLVGRGSKKRFFKFINGKRQCKNNIGPFQDGDGHLTNRDTDWAEGFNTSFVSIFNMDDGARMSQCSKLEGHDCK